MPTQLPLICQTPLLNMLNNLLFFCMDSAYLNQQDPIDLIVLPATEIMHIPVNRPTLNTTPRG